MYTRARYLIFFFQIIKTITQLQVSRFVFNYADEKHDGNGEFSPAGMILILVVSVAYRPCDSAAPPNKHHARK
jgi:hypothetical protein